MAARASPRFNTMKDLGFGQIDLNSEMQVAITAATDPTDDI